MPLGLAPKVASVSSYYPLLFCSISLQKNWGTTTPNAPFVGTPHECQFYPSRFDGWLIHSSLVEDLRFRSDLLTIFDVEEARDFIIGWCYAFCGG